MKYKIISGVFLLAAAAAAQVPGPRGGGMGAGMGGLRLLGAEAGRPGKVVKGAPYAADTSSEVTQTLPDGNKIHLTASARIYRDSEGRTRREPSLNALGSAAPGGQVPQLVFINDPVAGVSYVLNLADHTAIKTVWPQPSAGATPPTPKPKPTPPNVTTESLGRQTIAGVVADGTRTTRTIPAGQIGNTLPIVIVNERWYSPDLQMTVLSKHNDPRNGEVDSQVTNIIRSEPSPTLFVVPADFQVKQQTPGMGMRMRQQEGAPQ